MNTQSIIKIPRYKYNEYKIVLYPNEDISDKIQKIKQEFSEEFKTGVTFASKPAVNLAIFFQFDMLEERLINHLKTIATGCCPLKVELNGFGSLPSHTIFINTESKQTVLNLSKKLRSAQKIMTLNKENKPLFITDPHLIIARSLIPWQYEKGWLHYSHQYFTGRFMVSEIVLLKRPLSSSFTTIENNKQFRIVERFTFMNQPVSSKQGELFM